MAAIITDQLRVSNANKFVSEITAGNDSYYAFIGLTNPGEYSTTWDSSPSNPRDSFEQENDYWDTMVGLSKILPNNVVQVVRKNTWDSGTIYDMYRHDISIDNLSSTEKTSLYASNFYIINSNFKVYVCLDNGASPENNFAGNPSLDEPDFTDLEPKVAGTSGDGYIWKYLYTISATDLVKFDSIFYMPTPKDWETVTASQAIRNHAITSGQLKIIKIKNRGVNVANAGTYTAVPILGDGTGAEATIVVNSQQKIESIVISKGGSGYTFGTVDITNFSGGTLPDFDVIIPPVGGHGYDVYRELGATAILLYTRIENNSQNPDFITGNKISRFGIIQNPLKYTGLGPQNSTEVLTDTSVSATYALKLSGNVDEGVFDSNSYITQDINTNNTAAGRVVSYDTKTGVLKYWQDKRLCGFNTDGTKNTSPTYGFTLYRFTGDPGSGGSLTITGEDTTNLSIDDTLGTSENPATSTVINNVTYQLGQSFIQGTSNPEVEKYSGKIVYVDNRPSITRSQNQKEDIKVILQF